MKLNTTFRRIAALSFVMSSILLSFSGLFYSNNSIQLSSVSNKSTEIQASNVDNDLVSENQSNIMTATSPTNFLLESRTAKSATFTWDNNNDAEPPELIWVATSGKITNDDNLEYNLEGNQVERGEYFAKNLEPETDYGDVHLEIKYLESEDIFISNSVPLVTGVLATQPTDFVMVEGSEEFNGAEFTWNNNHQDSIFENAKIKERSDNESDEDEIISSLSKDDVESEIYRVITLEPDKNYNNFYIEINYGEDGYVSSNTWTGDIFTESYLDSSISITSSQDSDVLNLEVTHLNIDEKNTKFDVLNLEGRVVETKYLRDGSVNSIGITESTNNNKLTTISFDTPYSEISKIRLTSYDTTYNNQQSNLTKLSSITLNSDNTPEIAYELISFKVQKFSLGEIIGIVFASIIVAVVLFYIVKYYWHKWLVRRTHKFETISNTVNK